MHHQAGVNCENFTEVKFRDILLTGMGHRDSHGQTGTYGRSNLNQNLKPKSNFRFIPERPFAIPPFHHKSRPGALPPPPRCRGPGRNTVTSPTVKGGHQHRTPETLPKGFQEEAGRMPSLGRHNMRRHIWHSSKTSRNLLDSEILVCSALVGTKIALGCHPPLVWFNYFAASFFKALGIHFSRQAKK